MNVTPEMIEILKKDTILAQTLHIDISIDENDTWYSDKNIFSSLVKTIIYQQISTKVGNVIYQRFLDFFERNVSAEKLLAVDEATFKTLGISRQKASYLHNLADFTLKNDLSYEHLNQLEDEKIIEILTQIKGIGKWTAQMLLMFDFHRLDVFSELDVAIQNVMIKLYNIEEKGKPMLKKIQEIARQWQPYRTIACLYLWAYKERR